MEIHADRKPRACLLVLNSIADDPRVRRQGDALNDSGWDVIGAGLAGGHSPTPLWLLPTEERTTQEPDNIAHTGGGIKRFVLALDRVGERSEIVAAGVSVLRRIWSLAYKLVPITFHCLVALFPKTALFFYWRIFPVSEEIFRAASDARADVWIANDWHTLPIAIRLQEQFGGAIVYDTHEFAIDEYDQKLVWKVLRKPLVKAIEQAAFRKIASVITVSEGIAAGLQQAYKLEVKPHVVRNTPEYQHFSARRPAGKLRALYHGIVAPGRGLEACIESVASWNAALTLAIRGPGRPEYLKYLEEQAIKFGVRDRVHFLPPVPMISLVEAAAEFDIGVFSLPGHSRHNQYALPNKLFEYIAAGLCVCVSDLPEMRRIVEDYNVGVIIPDESPASIAAAINSLSPELVSKYSDNALTAAADLCWDVEKKRFLSIVEASQHQTRPPIESVFE